MIDFIYKPNGSRIWRWKFRLRPEDDRIEDISLGTPDKRAAEKRRSELVRERAQEQAGLLPSKPIREAADRALAEHLEDFLGDMRRRGKAEKYLANLEFRNGRLIAECGWKAAKDVTADSFQAWRQRQELAPKTANDYLEAVRCLFNWLVKHGRFPSNPMASVGKVEARAGQVRERRAFDFDEMRRLLAAVEGQERKAVYLMAVHTGLRRSELAALKWTDIRLDAVTPFVEVRASTTKNGKSASMRLHPEVIPLLQELKNACPASQVEVFRLIPRIERFRRDLKKAGVPYRDDRGRVADFHSLRKTLGTNLGKGGVARRVAMAVMRHSDGRLTDKIYTDESLLGTWSAVDSLPSYTEEASQPASQIASQKLVATVPGVALAGTTAVERNSEKTPVNIGESHVVALGVATGREGENGGSGGARTRNLCRDRAAL